MTDVIKQIFGLLTSIAGCKDICSFDLYGNKRIVKEINTKNLKITISDVFDYSINSLNNKKISCPQLIKKRDFPTEKSLIII